MPLPIIVTGYKVNERPQRFLVDEDWFDIAAVEVRILEADAEYFRVRTTDDKLDAVLEFSILRESRQTIPGFPMAGVYVQ